MSKRPHVFYFCIFMIMMYRVCMASHVNKDIYHFPVEF